MELGPGEDAVTVAGEGGDGGGHHHGHGRAVTGPPLRDRTGLGLDDGLLRERNSPVLGRLGEDAVTAVREGGGGGGHQTERYCPSLGLALVASPPLRHRTGLSLGHSASASLKGVG